MAGAGSGGLGDLHRGVAQRDPGLIDDELNTHALKTALAKSFDGPACGGTAPGPELRTDRPSSPRGSKHLVRLFKTASLVQDLFPLIPWH